MSNLDEARYGRACLLILNICPFVLRRVISVYYTRQGSLSIQDFLEKKKHDLFHLLRKRCCCRPHQSSITPMNNSQWDSLYINNSSSCRRGQRGDCPCQYDAKPGITTDMLDITLCCLFIKNICPGITINMAHVDTIREVRNNLIHAESASLDEPTFRHHWNIVENAIIDIALSVSQTLHSDTQKMVRNLENQSMNTAELAEELKRLLVDEERIDDHEERIDDLEENVCDITDDVARLTVNLNQTTQKVTQIEENVHQSTKENRRNISLLESVVVTQSREIRGIKQDQFGAIQEELSEHGKQIGDHGRHIDEQRRQIQTQREQFQQEIADIKHQMPTWEAPSKLVKDEPNISRLKQMLIKINGDTAAVIPISPLQERGDEEMPIELLYASVVIREDPKYLKKGCNSSQQTKYLTDPGDVFIEDENLVENIYMLGDAAHGKTTYCIWLLKKWCDAQQTDGQEFDKWRRVLIRFDFVFLLQFRNVNPNTASVIDMICQNVFRKKEDFHATIRHVLSSSNYRCLIIMDGLDEWNPNDNTKNQLTFKGMPNMEGVASSVSCFISMRPWVFPTILKMVKVSDRVIEIHGLSETGMKKVIENVLLYHYNLKDDPSKYTATYNKIVRHLRTESLRSFMQMPLLAVVCVQIWYKGKEVGDSMTSFYVDMLNMLIERAIERADEKPKFQIGHRNRLNCKLPDILSANRYIEEFISVLLKLGKVAYKGLLSKETRLVFQKTTLQKEIGERELQFALDVGLISQQEAPSLFTKNVGVHFFHKSMQEFLSVIYIVTQNEVSYSFCKHLSNVKVILEFSNTIMFICGMCPSLGSVISQRIVSVKDSDTEICRYRESPMSGISSTMTELCTLQGSCYREFQYGQTYNPVTKADKPVTQTDSPVTQRERPVIFHATDVISHIDTKTKRVNRGILSDQHVDMGSLRLHSLSNDDEHGISNIVLDRFLSNKDKTRLLVMIFIDGYNTDRSVPTFCGPSLKYLFLSYVTINTQMCVNVCPPLLNDMSQLRVLELFGVTLGEGGLGLSPDMVHIERIHLHDMNLGEGGLGLSPDMVHIQKVTLLSVNMPAAGWRKFVLSASNIHHRFEAVICDINIDDVSLTKIRSFPDFTVTQFSVNRSCRHIVHFARVWPPPKPIQYDK